MDHRVLESLIEFGLKPIDIKLYIFLAKNGPQTGKKLSVAMNMPKSELYQHLKNLKSRGIANSTPKRPAIFSAIPFDQVIDLLIKAKIEESHRTIQNIDKILSDWKNMEKNFGTK